MEELIQLRESIEKHNFVAALQIVDQLEEMSVEDKLNKFNYNSSSEINYQRCLWDLKLGGKYHELEYEEDGSLKYQ